MWHQAVYFRHDQKRLYKAAIKAWPKTKHILTTNDLETALAADSNQKQIPRALVLSGTGSCCYGKAIDGSTTKIGGWGHILGDKSSGYDSTKFNSIFIANSAGDGLGTVSHKSKKFNSIFKNS